MKKMVLVLAMMLLSSAIFAKQKVGYFRYILCPNVASVCKDDLDALISKGCKIVSFSLDYSQKCMIVVYEE